MIEDQSQMRATRHRQLVAPNAGEALHGHLPARDRDGSSRADARKRSGEQLEAAKTGFDDLFS